MGSIDHAHLFTKRRVVYSSEENHETLIVPDFSVVQYNILHDIPKSHPGYSYCPDQYKCRDQKNNSYRHKLLLSELRWLNSDIMCFQEVNLWQFDRLRKELDEWGYSGEFAEFGKEDTYGQGLAIFYRNSKFQLVRAKRYELSSLIKKKYNSNGKHATADLLRHPQVFQAVALQFRGTESSYLIVGNIHVLWGNLLQTVTSSVQVAMATQALNSFIASVKTDVKGGSFHHIFSGDFNSEPSFPVYHLLSEGKLTKKQWSKLKTVDYIRWPSVVAKPPRELSTEELVIYDAIGSHLTNPLKTLKSAYKVILGEEPELTNYEGNQDFWTLDYIWFSSDSLKPLSVLRTVQKSDIDPLGGLPNIHFPSDHLSLKACFKCI